MRIKSNLFLSTLLIGSFLGSVTMASTAKVAVKGAEELHLTAFGEPLKWQRVLDLEYPEKVFQDTDLLLVIHSTPYWDPQGLITRKRDKVSRWAEQRRMQILHLASADERKELNLQGESIFPYEGDAHMISLQGKGSIYLTGGNFSQCLCNAVRSLIIHHRSEHPLDLFILADAVYETPIPSVLAGLPGYQTRTSRVLSKIMNDLSDEQLLQYLKRDWLSSDTLPCPLYEPALMVPANPSYRYQVFRGKRSLGVIGNGAKLVNVHLLMTNDLIKTHN